jgi:hypothetical protein
VAAVPPRYLIVPDKSVGPISIGENTGPVIGAIGRPGRLGPDAGPEWIYGALQVDVNSEGLSVVALEVVAQYGATQAEAARYETASGIHVGSTVGEVEKAYRAARCSLHNKGCALTNSDGRATYFDVASHLSKLSSSTPIVAIFISGP